MPNLQMPSFGSNDASDHVLVSDNAAAGSAIH
jgi:hypothetical protein